MKPPGPPKPGFPLLNRLPEQQRKVLLAGLITFFLLAAATTLLLGYYIYQPEIRNLLHRPITAAEAMPTPACAASTLQIGDTPLVFKSTWQSSDGSWNIPVINPAPAYWIRNLEKNYVFILTHRKDALALFNSLKGGEQAVIIFDNCNASRFMLSAPQSGEPSTEMLLSQPAGIIVYLPHKGTSPGIMVRGELLDETTTSPPTFAPSTGEVNAEISLLETFTSEDKQTIQVVISILNYGSEPITLSIGDISLTPTEQTSLAASRVDPALPKEIKASETQTFTLIFARPESPNATLKIFAQSFTLGEY
jgi:hypothetical protein